MKNSRLPYASPALRAAAVSAGVLVLLGACAQQRASEDAEGRTPVMSSETSRTDNRAPLLTGDETPEASGEEGEAVSEREALESCNAYANAIVARDRRIDTDRSAGLDTGGPLSGSSRLSESMRMRGEENAYEQHFSNCMESQGYAEE